MASAKDIHVAPIDSKTAIAFVKRNHYSGKVTQNSQLHLGVFLNGILGGVMQFGPSMDKRKTQALVLNTGWNDFLELNRMAFSDLLPRNSESRAIAIAARIIKKRYPNIEWIISFADGCQCGDGTIYRASGFVLTGIKRNSQILELADGSRVAKKSLDDHVGIGGKYGSAIAKEQGAKPLEGFQLRYVLFLNPNARKRLTVPELPFSEITKAGAGMYKGKKHAGEIGDDRIPSETATVQTRSPRSNLEDYGKSSA